MTGVTDFITLYRWSDIFTLWFVVVDDAYQVLQHTFRPWRSRGPMPIFSDSEVITIALIADTIFGGREDKALCFVRQYHLDMFPHLPSPGCFNTRRRALNLITEQVRRVLLAQWGLLENSQGEYSTARIIDSAPIPVCTYTRAKESRTIDETWAPRELFFGVSASRKAKIFGFRLHLDTTTDQVVDSWMLAPARMHDSQSLEGGGGGLHAGEEMHNLLIMADGAFNNPSWLNSIRHKHNSTVRLWALPRRDSRRPWPTEFREFIAKIRWRIEAALSVLTTVFNIEQPGSRSLTGLVSRVSTRMLAYTLCFITGPLLAFLGFPPLTQN